jgi:hypothetical protein
MIFNPPPNWPVPKGATLPPGWQPDPAWGPAPAGWPLWIEKKSHLTRSILLGVAALVVLCVGGCVAVVAGGIFKTANTQHSRSEAGAKSCEGKSYADHQKNNDHCAEANGMVSVEDVEVTARPLVRDAAQSICTTVSYQNNSKKTVSFNLLDWKLQAPSGEVDNNLFVGGDLGSGELVPGGSKTGSVCFDPVGGAGQFVLIYKPSIWGGERGIWLYDL